ncbi:hypothetical protein GCM10022242_19690 [Nocardioides panacisoli]|uniref:Uncharacterized protein n=1 Tax=Nocardioides panacisoli TaxID=627624 RepID=A0ABP7IGC8_9ACTN
MSDIPTLACFVQCAELCSWRSASGFVNEFAAEDRKSELEALGALGIVQHGSILSPPSTP